VKGSRLSNLLRTTDHKTIGLMYLVTSFIMFMIGGLMAMLMRAELGQPGLQFLSPEQYNQLFTMHGTVMLLMFATPLFFAFGNLIMPLQIGAPDVAFPRLNALSFWLFLFGSSIVLAGFFTPGGAADFGWTAYAPLSDLANSPGAGGNMWMAGLAVSGLGTILGGVNFITTIVCLRAPGMTLFRMPIFVWNSLVTSVLILLAFPILTAALMAMLADRNLGALVYSRQNGGPMLWQHLFWFFGHPEVYIMVLPGFGIISEVIPVFSRKPIFGYKAVAAATAVIAFLATLVWAHHMFAAPIPIVVMGFFMLSSFLIGVPTGVKIFNWIATLWRGSILPTTSLHFAVGMIAVFTLGGITGIFLAVFPVDWQLNNTYFVVAHFHYTIFGGAIFPVFAGLYYWFPKMAGRFLNERLGKISFWMIFIGFNATFLVQHALGLTGMPRRVYTYPPNFGWSTYNLISTIGSFILGAGVLVTIGNVARSLKVGAIAGPDPWKGNTLEWFTSSPPPPNNFDVIPRVRSIEPMRDIRRQVERDTGVTQKTGGGERFVRA
jgi:cytochrome c oxidase subunit 1